MNDERLEQHRHYQAVRARIWGTTPKPREIQYKTIWRIRKGAIVPGLMVDTPPPPQPEPVISTFAVVVAKWPLGMSYPSVKKVIALTAAYFEISEQEITDNCRLADHVMHRGVALTLVFKYCHKTDVSVGRIFKKDHTSILHMRRLIAKRNKWGNTYTKAIEVISPHLEDIPTYWGA